MRPDEQIVFTAGNPPPRCGCAIYFRRMEMITIAGANRFEPKKKNDMAHRSGLFFQLKLRGFSSAQFGLRAQPLRFPVGMLGGGLWEAAPVQYISIVNRLGVIDSSNSLDVSALWSETPQHVYPRDTTSSSAPH
ncbi:hypothetical protein [Mesorhizobium sp. WSM4304]|uniref:hypothetical protein n=1 Tax=unclassified Mesorhizobium TaxID=325217 RepID=UPI0032AED303